MVLTEEEKKARQKEYARKYYENNKDKVREINRKYREDNKEKLREKKRIYRKNNKNKIREDAKKYYEKNKSKIKEYSKTDKGLKSQTLSDWKRRGLVDDFDKVYERWEYTLFCDECRCDLDQCTKSRKCMDHDHETGLFRNILCNSCNAKRG